LSLCNVQHIEREVKEDAVVGTLSGIGRFTPSDVKKNARHAWPLEEWKRSNEQSNNDAQIASSGIDAARRIKNSVCASEE
jgi:hypothetical protein